MIITGTGLKARAGNHSLNQKDLIEGEETLDLKADETGKVSFPVEWGAYRLEVKAPNDAVSSVRFWAGYSWQDNSDGSGSVRPDRVTLKLDKPGYRPGDTMKLHIAAPAAGKGYAMVESSEGPLWVARNRRACEWPGSHYSGR